MEGTESQLLANTGILPNEIAVITRTNGQLKEVVNSLEKKGIKAISLDDVDSITNKKIYYGTMHSIKGFEFKVIFIIGANDETVPLKAILNQTESEKEKDMKLRMEKSLLYVAITRARDMLFITGSPEISSWLNWPNNGMKSYGLN